MIQTAVPAHLLTPSPRGIRAEHFFRAFVQSILQANRPEFPNLMQKSAHFRRFFRILHPCHVFLGLAIALSGCSEGSIQSVETIVFGEADELFIQPIRVCDDNGNNCAGVNLFADITAKILAQARLKVSFLPANQLNASRFLRIDDNRNRSSPDYEFYELTRTGGKGAFGRHPDSERDKGPINVWFVDEIEGSNGFTQFGLAWVDANGVLISRAALEFGSNGRTDTVAHEIGHNLGLRHGTLGAGGSDNLMTDGDRRNIPNSPNDVYPDGAGVSRLNDAQIKEIQNSPFVSRGSPGILTEEVSETDRAQIEAQTWLVNDLLSGETAPLFAQSFWSGSVSTAWLATAPAQDKENSATEVPESTPDWLGWLVIGISLASVARRLRAYPEIFKP